MHAGMHSHQPHGFYRRTDFTVYLFNLSIKHELLAKFSGPKLSWKEYEVLDSIGNSIQYSEQSLRYMMVSSFVELMNCSWHVEIVVTVQVYFSSLISKF